MNTVTTIRDIEYGDRIAIVDKLIIAIASPNSLRNKYSDSHIHEVQSDALVLANG
ncbi:MAG: hypothetical protein ACFCAD_26615 [Pleurocapsa sp.]